jgi:aryl-alcohol dehydrogenase-like predicted oxidoreductase
MNNITICQDDDVWKLFDNNDNKKESLLSNNIICIYCESIFLISDKGNLICKDCGTINEHIFDQNPEDELFPLCKKLDVGIIARVPFDEGSLTGLLTYDTIFPADDWRSTYFVPENLASSVDHANALKPIIPEGMDLPEMALRFILSNPDVGTIIPGMRKIKHVQSNIACSDGQGLAKDKIDELRNHRWERQPTEWSQ